MVAVDPELTSSFSIAHKEKDTTVRFFPYAHAVLIIICGTAQTKSH